MDLRGKKALVTGARRWIGRGIAEALAEAGCDVGINDIARDDEVTKTIQRVQAYGVAAEFFHADIADEAQVTHMFDAFTARFERIDILVNNAYWAEHMPFLEIDRETWDRTLAVCLTGYFLCSQAAARKMVAQGGGGSIVHVSSVHSRRVWPTDVAYGVAKAGIDRLTEGMAVELGEYGIRVNAVLPGYINAEQVYGEPIPENTVSDERRKFIPAGRYATPEDIGRAVAFLASHVAGNITGATLPVDGGFLATGIP
jgi:NAD(P)-dependent dehydrogenase (short-subunit alcohol dehydrogenase family)